MASLLANSVATLLARLAVPVFSFAISVTIARVYGAAGLGAYVQLMALMIIFQTVASAGIPLLLTRDIAADPWATRAIIERARSFALVSGTAATLGIAAYAFLVLDGELLPAAAALALTMIPSAWLAIQEGFFMATRSHHRVTVVAVVENFLKLVFAGAVLLVGGGIAAICAAIAAARLVASQVGRRLMAAAGEPLGWGFDRRDAMSFGRVVSPFAVLLVISMVYFRVDVVLVGLVCDETQVGLYGAAITLYTVALLLLSSVMSAVYPRLSTAFRDSREGFVRATMLSVKFLAVGVVPMAVVMICFSDRLLTLVFGGSFSTAAPVLSLLAASLPLHAINGALGQALQAGQHQTAMVRIVLAGLAAHVVGIVLLVPILGIEGAALSVLVSSFLVSVGCFVGFHRNVSPVRFGWRGAAALVAIIAPITATLLVPAPWLLAVGIAALAGFSVLVVVGAVSRAEFDRLFRAVWPSRAEIRP